ncbi:hypothetical protein L532_3283 [Bordetella bronchiseptica OSU095]|nr:hypothetical protein L532_3283 [Bordetella bronchiseptica OSU095]
MPPRHPIPRDPIHLFDTFRQALARRYRYASARLEILVKE